MTDENNTSSTNESLHMPFCSTQYELPTFTQFSHNNQNLNFTQTVINTSSASQNESISNPIINSSTIEIINSFRDDLSVWAVQCNVSNSTIDKLLKIMKKSTNISTINLPLDSRTLLNTPCSNKLNVRSVIPGHYSHFGLKTGILRYASSNLSEIKIAIGIDGLPLAKSSNTQLWPILAYIIGMPKTVFPLGIYHGNSRPKNSDDFLADFISESKELLSNGIVLNNILKKVTIDIFVCDAPAKAFILKIKGHSGFSSCTRCI